MMLARSCDVILAALSESDDVAFFVKGTVILLFASIVLFANFRKGT
jgi:hypothetical protein